MLFVFIKGCSDHLGVEHDCFMILSMFRLYYIYSYYKIVWGDDPLTMSIMYGATTFLFLFYPLAGCLADIRWGRHKTVVNSLCFTFWSSVLRRSFKRSGR